MLKCQWNWRKGGFILISDKFSGNSTNSKRLTKKQKETVGLLSIGTFLEYFDLMLYVHMAVLLNDLFFPKSDPITQQLFAATAFCTTYIMRPFGGYLIGKLGDTIGRKPTIIITSFIMSISCAVIAITPTYQDIGIISCVIIIACRALQGVASLGEKMGAYVFVSESFKNPARCVIAGVVGVSSITGGLFALIIVSIIFWLDLNWRLAFAIGALVAGFGFLARSKLRETKDFISYRRKNTKKMHHKVSIKTKLAFFFTELHAPILFYIAIVYLINSVKKPLQLSLHDISNQNIKALLLNIIISLLIIKFVKKIHPIKIALLISYIFIIILPFLPYWISNTSNLVSLLCIQVIFISITRSTAGTLDAIQYKYFPIQSRFTYAVTIFGIANPLGKVIASFGLIFFTKYFEVYGILFIVVPTVIGYIISLHYFKKLEIQSGNYYSYPNTNDDNELIEDLQDSSVEEELSVEEKLMKRIKKINEENNNKINDKIILKAINFAKKWHEGQYRKSGEPYYYHPLEVAEVVAEHYLKTDVIVGAILHDVLEDTDCTIELIERDFNSRVAQIVYRLTRYYKDGKKQSIEEIIGSILDTDDKEALLIKQVDRLHNLSTIGVMKEKKQIETVIETLKDIMGHVAYSVDNLNVNDKLKLERLMLIQCREILVNGALESKDIERLLNGN
ncbi:MAG: MHS family proline/betaine transporter-like MFS transporter [Candidatus Midichloriaceae bacterium]